MYRRLRTLVQAREQEWKESCQQVYYMATPPFLFADIACNLGRAQLHKDRERARIVVEKPLGRDLASYQAINRALTEYFHENQIYRIDHFLGKETVQNILALRFANPIFEPIWDRRYVDHVAITVAETLGVEHRGSYYDHAEPCGTWCRIISRSCSVWWPWNHRRCTTPTISATARWT